MAVTQDYVVTGPFFQQRLAGDVLVAPGGMPASSAQKLGNVLAGTTPTFTPATGLTAHAGGTQAAALPLTASVNVVATVATAADSVALPLAVAGLTITVFNTSANSMQIFGSGTDTINAAATATGVAQIAVSGAIYYAITSAPAGNWRRVYGTTA